ncbi:hypothetical protein GII33_09815 [Gordonia pseudamarae]|uniref:Uncharacterized protein n=1 Tax=Gordonia pseudamarae TaxID=2831662 RepID=A0ABX6IGY6_9ACTN|nr:MULTISPECIES: hypothetical protein [Gordonia]MBD0020924.1 hypothetical protein [Gordonia sp. (in: high G+C Gram-positive bacteria)]QHN26219.1 hypothetical protein GII33_09815 [Gordonia pseudamarae]QHN35112.1 hypothetical protein GII31_09610 [Gordonia pseudamarae]
MLASVVFVPSAPLLVPQLAGPRATEAVAVREAVRAAGTALAELAPRWVAVGAGDVTGGAVTGGAAATGSFARYGVDVAVSLRAPGFAGAPVLTGGGPDAAGTARLPLSMLIAAWLREAGGADSVEPLIIDPGAPVQECLRTGRMLAAAVAAADTPIGVLVVGDGSTQLSPSAPGGGLVPESVALNDNLVAAIASGDRDVLAGISPQDCDRAGVGGRAAWQVAAALCDGVRVSVQPYYEGCPFGVGYVVASWTPVVPRTPVVTQMPASRS